LARATRAYRHPDAVAGSWRGHGGKVVGVLGHDVPRELVLAAGMLPIRLAPARLGPPRPAPTVADSHFQLAPDCQIVLDALTGGELEWIDALVIGRDNESHTKLFYVLRELVNIAEAPHSLWWFCDLVRLPSEASAHYNRVRARQFVAVLSDWSGEQVSTDALERSVAASNFTTSLLEQVSHLRRADPARLGGVEALLLDGAALTLPPDQCHDLLRAALADPGPAKSGRRVFVSGSPEDDLALYEAIEEAGFVVVGEDHDWGDAGWAEIRTTDDPLDGLVDRYHLGPPSSARGGLDERARYTCSQALSSGAEVVLQLVFDHDEAAEWEFPGVRDQLAGHGIPVVQTRVPWPGGDPASIERMVETLSDALGGRDG
jgi:benzoyl-CoA reductase/2-hydroxyglutaryl-CoA dehydratase subunit BcrC/BadD/HgdB